MELTWKTLVNIGSDNGLLPDGTKPLSEPMLTYHHRYYMALTWEQLQKMCLIHNISSEFTPLKSLLHLPGSNELFLIMA